MNTYTHASAPPVINPHFLFNTLNIISSLSKQEQAPQTESTIDNLSNLLRYNLKHQNELVTIEREADIIRSYMAIQKLRFGQKLQYTETIDSDLLKTEIPGMLLQPLIENAVKHGLEPISRQGTIELIIHRTADGLLEIRILDNGQGISLQTIQSIMKDTEYSLNIPGQGIGLRNVKRRLDLQYGTEALSIRQRKEGGTACIIHIPLSGSAG